MTDPVSASGPPWRSRTFLTGAALGFLLGALVGCAIGKGGSQSPAPQAPQAAATSPATASAKPAPAVPPAAVVAETEPPPPWTYDEKKDEMRDQVTKTACTTSRNEVRLNPPYSDVSARLCVRKHPRFGTDVFLALNGDGQILCTSYEGCTIHARFDAGKAQAFSAAGSSDGSSNIVFFANAARVIPSLKQASTTRVEIELYEAGIQQLEFDTTGLQWP